jgi:hypothetical protein
LNHSSSRLESIPTDNFTRLSSRAGQSSSLLTSHILYRVLHHPVPVHPPPCCSPDRHSLTTRWLSHAQSLKRAWQQASIAHPSLDPILPTTHDLFSPTRTPPFNLVAPPSTLVRCSYLFRSSTSTSCAHLQGPRAGHPFSALPGLVFGGPVLHFDPAYISQSDPLVKSLCAPAIPAASTISITFPLHQACICTYR